MIPTLLWLCFGSCSGSLDGLRGNVSVDDGKNYIDSTDLGWIYDIWQIDSIVHGDSIRTYPDQRLYKGFHFRRKGQVSFIEQTEHYQTSELIADYKITDSKIYLLRKGKPDREFSYRLTPDTVLVLYGELSSNEENKEIVYYLSRIYDKYAW